MSPRVRHAVVWALPFLIACVLYGGALLALSPSPNADEPHYALEAISLVRDGDRDLANQYADPELLRQVFGSTALAPHGVRYPHAPDRLISSHSVGLPILLAPAAALSTSTQWMRWEMVLLAALAALLLMRLLERLPWRSPVLRWTVWTAIVASAPLVMGAGLVLTEVPAMVLVLGGILLLTRRPRPSPAALAAAATCAALLPWLNSRFLPLTAALALAALVLAWRDPRRGTAIAAVAAPLALSGVLFAVGFLHWYGSIMPSAQHQAQVRTWSGAYRFGPGNLLSPAYGLLPQAPVALLAIVGIGVAVRRLGWPALLGAVTAFVYLAMIAASGIGFNGTTFAGRLPEVLLPLAVVPLMAVAVSARVWRWALAVLTAASLALTVHAVVDKAMATAATGEPGTLLHRYERLWPDYAVHEDAVMVTWSPAEARAGVGRTVRDDPLPAGSDAAVAAPAGAAGVVERVTSDVLPDRAYASAVTVRADEPSPDLEIVARTTAADGTLLGEWRLTGAQAPPADGYRLLVMPFPLTRDQRVTVEITTNGAAGLRAGPVQVVNAAGASQAAVGGFPAVGKTIAWTVVLLGAAVAAVLYDRRRGSTSRA